ncbi:MAG: DUF2326 domain-containing protein [Ruthenibacterium sp.]
MLLKMIRCDKFIENGSVRKPIIFHAGLNTVLGSESGSNSIGKSTFLMILDFVFGGEDYVVKSADVQENVKVHTIEFMFEDGEEKYYFSRSTGDHTVFNICSEKFEVVDTESNDKYMNFLAEKYGVKLPGLSLRGAIGRFFRVYGRETLYEKHPLKSATKETDKAAIDGLLKIYNRYAAVEEQSRIADVAKDEETTFKKARKYQYIAVVPNKTAYKANVDRIKELQDEAEQLAKNSSQGLLDMDSMQAQQLAELRHQLSNFKRQRTRLYAQKKGAEADRDFAKHSFQRDYDALLQFFPEANVERLESIEQFHRKLTGILKKEFKENADSIQAMIDLASGEIQALEAQVSEISKVPNVSQAVLDRYSKVKKELQQLQEANDNFEKVDVLHEKTQKLVESLNALVLHVIANVQADVNRKMKELNDIIYNGSKTAPTLNIQDASHYLFFTPNDSGTGSQYRGLIVFDLATLRLTKLPVLAHDSILLKQIEDVALEKILEFYVETPKQVFIAIDKEGSYTERSQELINNSTVLRLYPHGGELFGWPWNETKN